MKYLYLTFITACCLFITTAATAQKTQTAATASKHELSIYGLDGYSSLLYTVSSNGANIVTNSGTNSSSGGVGGGAGLGYTFNISPSLGIVTGVEMSIYASKVSFGIDSSKYEVGTGNDLFRFKYSLSNYKETQSVTLFSIPVMAQYSLPVGSGGTMRFYLSGGFKLGFPISAKADISPGSASTYGFCTNEYGEYKVLPTHGFANNISLPDTKKDIDLGFSAALALETGLRFTLTDKIGLYTGLYFDYGLNSIQKVNDKHPLEYDLRHLSEYDVINEKPFLYNSVLNSGFVDKVNLLSVGLKVRISFNL
jgi:opacity protein-like surface antigen